MSNPFFTLVMPVFLGEYSGNYGRSATDRAAKLLRAVRSVADQGFLDWELVIVADGCDATWSMRDEIMAIDPRIRLYRISKQRIWSGMPRNIGIHMGTGRYVRYIDSDDVLQSDDLSSIAEGLKDAGMPELALCSDYAWDGSAWYERMAVQTRANGIGCSNIVVVRDHRAFWPEIVYRHPSNGYDHDRQYFRHLCQHFAPVSITGGRYRVMHVPRKYDL
ncbi:MAG: glycosyltransferase family 2 protein [Desulfurellales bacterium]|nr:MAG: glycosyltransferase family 2 protein [Desulfurellales bacterium]